MKGRWVLGFVAGWLMALVAAAVGQKITPKEYKLSEVQQLRLQVQQKDAQLLQAQLQQVQRQFQEKVSELMSTAQKIKLENGWPPETTFDPDKLLFSAPAKEEKKP